MTFIQKLEKEHPDRIVLTGNSEKFANSCPSYYGYEDDESRLCRHQGMSCVECLNREIPDTANPATKTTSNEAVKHPPHYSTTSIECWDALDAMVSSFTDPVEAALTWQVGKYIWRHPHKGKPVEDLKKARDYLDRLIEREAAHEQAPV